MDVLQALLAREKAEPWRKEALCARPEYAYLDFVDPDRVGGDPSAKWVADVLTICSQCPARLPCLRSALESPFLTVGAWGGTISSERQQLLPRVERAHHFGALEYLPPRPEDVEAAVELFETTLDQRLAKWRNPPKTKPCIECGAEVPTQSLYRRCEDCSARRRARLAARKVTATMDEEAPKPSVRHPWRTPRAAS